MKRNNLILFFFVLSGFFVVISYILLINSRIGVREYEVFFIIDNDSVGFDTNISSLTFGKLPPGASSERKIVFENYKDESVNIEILVSKNIAKFVNFQSSYSIQPKNNVTIPISVRIPYDAEEGEYKGKIKIQMKR